jgi:hypothetical protein
MVVLTLALWLKPIRTNREIEQGMDEFAREYGGPNAAIRAVPEIAKQLSGFCLMLDRLIAAIH